MQVKKGPWTVTGSKTVYQNPWITVQEDAIIQPNGKEGIFSVVHMKHGVAILPIDADGNVYLTQEYHYAAEQVTIEVVSGGIDAGEAVEAAAHRELKEELGITAGELVSLGKLLPLTSAVEITNHLFIAKNLAFTEAEPDGTEVITRVKVSLQDAIAMVHDGRISDATSVSLILKYESLVTDGKCE